MFCKTPIWTVKLSQPLLGVEGFFLGGGGGGGGSLCFL